MGQQGVGGLARPFGGPAVGAPRSCSLAVAFDEFIEVVGLDDMQRAQGDEPRIDRGRPGTSSPPLGSPRPSGMTC